MLNVELMPTVDDFFFFMYKTLNKFCFIWNIETGLLTMERNWYRREFQHISKTYKDVVNKKRKHLYISSLEYLWTRSEWFLTNSFVNDRSQGKILILLFIEKAAVSHWTAFWIYKCAVLVKFLQDFC